MLFRASWLLLCCWCWLVPAQAQIYKTVDAQGHISYTNTAPVGADAHKSEQVEVHEGYSNKLSVTQTGSVSYCGSIALPVRDIRFHSFFEQVSNKEKFWQSNLDRLQKQAGDYVRYNRTSAAPTPANLVSLAEFQCACEWAQLQRHNAKEEKAQLEQKSAGLSAYLKELTEKEVAVCGAEPIYSSGNTYFEEKRQAWQRCTGDSRAKMGDVERDLDNADRQLLDIRKIETL